MAETHVAEPQVVGVAFVGMPLELPLFGPYLNDRLVARLIGTETPFEAKALVTFQRPAGAYSITLSSRATTSDPGAPVIASSFPLMMFSGKERDAGVWWRHEYQAGEPVDAGDLAAVYQPLKDAARLLRGVAPQWELDAARLSLERARDIGSGPSGRGFLWDDGSYSIKIIGEANRLRVGFGEFTDGRPGKAYEAVLVWNEGRGEYGTEYLDVTDGYGTLLERHPADEMPGAIGLHAPLSARADGMCDVARYYRDSLLKFDLSIATREQQITAFESARGNRRGEILRQIGDLEREQQRAREHDERDL